jgi:hypothetical protein
VKIFYLLAVTIIGVAAGITFPLVRSLLWRMKEETAFFDLSIFFGIFIFLHGLVVQEILDIKRSLKYNLILAFPTVAGYLIYFSITESEKFEILVFLLLPVIAAYAMPPIIGFFRKKPFQKREKGKAG